MGDTTDERLARVETTLQHVLDALNRLTERIDKNDENYVTRREFDALKKDVESRRAPWWAVASVVISVLVLGWAILGPGILAAAV